ncbi:S1C family serine protease [Tautonia plasticadhaerens]|uniref:Putative periplasmic serine endoprotease DegP-like n=1 Tax=Tautonia plasticadhaerens TaxID=2527974 RepID=A0A518HAH1_9BACT|nr:trypsin-like peptidase domain-containing protein [Tautonia plasticadhaerens]QDV37829.1 putative periplasmic serine endoprotease DegP-like precursor [Tautonia plasticadhaerens]
MPRFASASAFLLMLAAGFGLGLAANRPASLSAGPARAGEGEAGTAEGVEGLEHSEEAIYQSLSRQYEQFYQVNRTFELVSKVVSRAVVHIVALKKDVTEEGRTRRTYEESGSGVIVRSDSRPGLFVLTNNHVISGADPADIHINLHDGRLIRPQAIHRDEDSDVAVLELPVDDLPVARLGDSDEALPGTWVLAVGSPFGLTHSVSQGIISARGRQERDLYDSGVQNQDFLQTDAAINPGNSGGPLVNLRGEVVGINTAIASHGGGNEGVGYSIPINLARWAMEQLINTGKVRRGAIGISLQDVFPEDYERFGLDRPRGTRISAVAEDSPAKQSGIQQGDVIVRFNETPVNNTWHLINMVSTTPIGEAVELVVNRGGELVTVRVQVADFDQLTSPRHRPAPPSTNPEGYLVRP